MKTGFLAMSTAVLLAGTAAFAAEETSKIEQTPGHQMKQESAPGASEYAPGRNTENRDQPPGKSMQGDTGPGASEYAPKDKSKSSSKY